MDDFEPTVEPTSGGSRRHDDQAAFGPDLPAEGADDEALGESLGVISSGRDVLGDVGVVLSTRLRMDGLLLAALSAPGLAPVAMGRLRGFIEDGSLTRAQAALDRVAGVQQVPGDRA